MPLRHAVGFAAFLLSLVPAHAAASEPAAMPPELDQYIAKALRDWEAPGLAIAIVKDDRVVAARGYGVRELGKPDPVDGETLFDIASLTKSFTAAGAAVLVDEGKLRWDDRVRERLPRVSFPDACLDDQVTLRDLLSHRTGLQPANSLFYFMSYDREELMRRVRFLKPQAPFRAGMVYSNILYSVAGEMAAAAAGTSWADLIRTRLIEPAGMRSTRVETRPSGPNTARPHAVIDGVQQPIRPFDFTMVGPASSIFSNAVDLARWLRLQLNEGELDGRQIVSRASMGEMHSPQSIIQTTPEMRRARFVEHFGFYGLGWQIMDYRGEPMHWHSGNADGMPAYMVILPRLKLGVAVMVNTWGAPTLHGAIASKVIDAYVKGPEVDWSGEALARHRQAVQAVAEARAAGRSTGPDESHAHRPLSDYAGTYRAPLWGDVHVRLEQGVLTLQAAAGAKGDLSHRGGDDFLVTWADPLFREYFHGTQATFGADEAGRIVRLAVTLNRDTVEVTRRPDR